ncbi:hypothetical protein [Streptomyces sp. NPDC048277]|uniref:hypothetical protein n=1 Tax=Streptomyces sp. NPDC048277 TaxID=3155027 RepID=UPI0033EE6860
MWEKFGYADSGALNQRANPTCHDSRLGTQGIVQPAAIRKTVERPAKYIDGSTGNFIHVWLLMNLVRVSVDLNPAPALRADVVNPGCGCRRAPESIKPIEFGEYTDSFTGAGHSLKDTFHYSLAVRRFARHVFHSLPLLCFHL